MGVNIYLVPQPSNEDWEIIKEAANNKDWNAIQNVTKELDDPIHIGKASVGWQFLFASNDSYYEDTRDSIESFIRKAVKHGTYCLEDEYGQSMTPDEFWTEYVDNRKDLKSSGDYINDNLCFTKVSYFS